MSMRRDVNEARSPTRSRPAKVKVDAGLEFLDVEACARSKRRRRGGGEGQRLRAERKIIVFDFRRPVLADAVFQPDAGRPAGLGDGAACAVAGKIGEAVAVACESGAALAIDQQTIKGRADPARNGRG